jgi:hypothetical protein
MFLAAMLHAESWSAPVKIRNLSANGGMVEAEALPGTGCAVRLVRGRLAVAGRIMWSSGGRCGVPFAALVSPRDWMAPAEVMDSEPGGNVVALLPAGPPPAGRGTEVAERAAATIDAADVRLVARLMAAISGQLSAAPATAEARRAALQQLDIGVETLVAIADLASGGGTADDGEWLSALRQRCVSALDQR